MIVIEPVPESGHVVTCPHCRAELFKVFGDRHETAFAGYLFQDGDTIPIYGNLSEMQREGFGWTTHFAAGRCPFCDGRLLSINANFMDVEPDTDTEDVLPRFERPRRNFHCSKGLKIGGVPFQFGNLTS
jgi:hypothetical protein